MDIGEMNPDATKHNPDPDYLRGLIEKAGISQRKAAQIIGVNERVLRQYLANRNAKSALDAPYPVQYCLELLCLEKLTEITDTLTDEQFDQLKSSRNIYLIEHVDKDKPIVSL